MAKFEDNYKVEVTSMTNGRTGIFVPHLHFKRLWNKKGAKSHIDFGILREAIYEPGVEAMFKDGILHIEDMAVKIELGLEPEGATKPENIIVLTDAQKKRALTVMPLQELRELLGKVTYEQRMDLADFAIANECSSFDRCDLIKQFTNIDVISAIQLKRQDTQE